MILGVFGFERDMGIHVLVICSFKDLFTFIFKKALHSNISCFALLVIYNASSKIKRFRGDKAFSWKKGFASTKCASTLQNPK